MGKSTNLLAAVSIFTVSSLHAASVQTHFSSNFDNAVDNGSTIIDNGYQMLTTFGDPGLHNGALLFNTGGSSTYEQTKINLATPPDHRQYHVEFDLLTQNLANSQWGFGVYFDTPTVQSVNFNNCCSNSVYTFNPNTFTNTNPIGLLTDDQLMHVTIDINLTSNLWVVDISGVGQHMGSFYSESGDILSMRFGLAPAHGSIISPDPSINVYVDNLVVTSTVPVPAAIWLMMSGLLGLVNLARRKK